MIPPINYYASSVYQDELNSLFTRSWIFVGLKLDFSGLSHAGRRIGDHEFVIQFDADGKPRAFRNVCSHRSSRLCKEGMHTGPVRCPYHGWVYDRQGIPVGIPLKEAFPAVIENPNNFKLDEVACDSAGQFIFVRIAPEGGSLKDYLGDEFDFLIKCSKSMKSIEYSFEDTVDANWKIVIENSLEGYHVPTLHSKTFIQAEGMGKNINDPIFNLNDPIHCHLNHTADADWVRRFNKIEKQIGKWPWRFEQYTHHLIFPNLTITSFMGYSFHVQIFNPEACNRTKVRSMNIGVNFEGTTSIGAKMIEKIYKDSALLTRRIFDEDGDICKEIQAGLYQASRSPVFGLNLEERVKHFHNAYCNFNDNAD
jgi:phenylpropionate dioxygenase-like ring-hydroxylating dioxygenase large terminal subunit